MVMVKIVVFLEFDFFVGCWLVVFWVCFYVMDIGVVWMFGLNVGFVF